MKENINIQILKAVEGKTARVYSDGFYCEGSLEGDVKLHYNQNLSALELSVPLRWNNVKIFGQIKKEMNRLQYDEKKLKIDYDDRDVLFDLFEKMEKETFVNAGAIYAYYITNIEVSTDDKGEIMSLKIKFKESTVNLHIRK